tara:strand:+ start:855 stop:1553 length:699 start_codon:yes stop_codon:yes gene_type:complete
MKIIIGLGNPGEKYKHTRHNAGFAIADALAQKYSKTSWIKKFSGLYCKCSWKDQNFLILKPETFMNNSGQSVRSIASFYKLNPSKIIIIHDDLDLKIGQIKVKFSGGHGGHNGLKSIHQAIGDQYVRLRIGIGRPNEKNQISSYVLSNFNVSENDLMETHKKTFQIGIGELLNHNFGNFMGLINNRISKDLKLPRKQNSKPFIEPVSSKPLENETPDKSTFNFLQNLLKKFN